MIHALFKCMININSEVLILPQLALWNWDRRHEGLPACNFYFSVFAIAKTSHGPELETLNWEQKACSAVEAADIPVEAKHALSNFISEWYDMSGRELSPELYWNFKKDLFSVLDAVKDIQNINVYYKSIPNVDSDDARYLLSRRDLIEFIKKGEL